MSEPVTDFEAEKTKIEQDCQMNRNVIKGFLFGIFFILLLTIIILVFLLRNSHSGGGRGHMSSIDLVSQSPTRVSVKDLWSVPKL